MLGALVGLSWLDVWPVLVTCVTLALVEVFNRHFVATTATPTSSSSSLPATTESTTTAAAATIQQQSPNGKLQKQKSGQGDDASSASSSSPSSSSSTSISPPTSARNSINFLHNGSVPHPPSPDSLSDEYHEDEDTLSLENLFPCDQSEIYASKKISFIIDELIQTEANYVSNLRKGLSNYGRLDAHPDLPEALRGEEKRSELLGNIEEILVLHERQILPMMLRNQRDLKQLFDEFAASFDKNLFYCYVVFTMNKKFSMQLRQEHRGWFTVLQSELNDKLGIDSFLVQPIQRLTRYPLLLQQFISEFYKAGISCKPVLTSVCKLETRMRRLLQVVNQAEEVLAIDEVGEVSILSQGHFRRSTEFDVYHHRSRKRYRAKVFLFDRCLLCAEVRKRRLVYRCDIAWPVLELQLSSAKVISVASKGRPPWGASAEAAPLREELELSAPEGISVTQWLRCARKIQEEERVEAARRGKFSLPMDLVLGVAFAVWLMWRYLY